MGINGQRRIASARGDVVDFDLLKIKQQLADAPGNIEVARRQAFIDDKETGKSIRKKKDDASKAAALKKFRDEQAARESEKPVTVNDFENSNGDIPPALVGKPVQAVPVVPEKPAVAPKSPEVKK